MIIFAAEFSKTCFEEFRAREWVNCVCFSRLYNNMWKFLSSFSIFNRFDSS